MRCCGHLLSDQFITCYLLLLFHCCSFCSSIALFHPVLYSIFSFVCHCCSFCSSIVLFHPVRNSIFSFVCTFYSSEEFNFQLLCRRLISNFQLFMQEINIQSVAKNDLLRTLSSEDPIRKIVSSFAIFSHLNQPVDASSDSSSLSSSSTSTANNTSWVRFFVEEQENYFVCLLLVDPLHKHHRDHTNKISKSGGISNVARHFRGICHKEHHEVEKMLFSNRFTRSSLALHHQRSMRIS